MDELTSTILRSIENKYSKENTRMEILSLRLAENKSPSDCLYGVMPCLLDQCFPKDETNLQTIVGRIKAVVDEWKGLLKEFIHDPVDEDILVEIVEEYCMKTEFLQACFHLLLPPLYQAELLSDTAVFRWRDKAKTGGPVLAKFLANVFDA